jgi:hypothetical protein
LVVDGWCFPRRRRGEAGGDDGFGGRRRVQKTARKSRGKLSLDVPERGEKEGELEVRRGCFTASESTVTGGRICELRRAILAAWRLRIERGREEMGEGVRGVIG